MKETKAIAKIGLAMHVGTSKHFASVVYRCSKKLKRLDKKDDKLLEKVQKGVEDKSIKLVLDNAMKFIDIEEKELEKEKIIDEDGFVIEYRVVKKIDVLLGNFELIEKKQEEGGKIKESLDVDISEMKSIFKDIKEYVDKEVKLERDEVLGRHFIRDQDFMRGEAWLERILKREARHLKGDVRPTQHLIRDVYDLLKDIQKGKNVDDALLKKLTEEVKELKKDVKAEFDAIYHLKQIMVKLDEKHDNVLEKFNNELKKLEETHFPEGELNKIVKRRTELVQNIKELKEDNLVWAKTVKLQVKRAA